MAQYPSVRINKLAFVGKDVEPAELALLRRQVERLDELAEEGLRMARLIREQVSDDPATAPAGAVTAFARVAKAVRLCGLLQARLIKDMEEGRKRNFFLKPLVAEEASIAAAKERGRLDPANDHKARVEKIVERQVKALHKGDEDEVERLMLEACERLDDEDIYRDVLNRPVGELVALICRDLGVEPDWPRLAEEAWAQEEIENGVEGSPFLPPPQAAGGGVSPVIAKGDHANAEERVAEGAGGFRPPPDSSASRLASRFDGPS